MDRPDLVVACIVGDGESETGPTAAAWHAGKYIDPKESGAVIPIVHVNGFKISERTIYGCMDHKELATLFTGYGYQPRFVEDLEDIDGDLGASMEWALSEIHRIQKAARSGKPIMKPQWPVLILRTPKGWGGPKKVHGEIVEGSFHAHQVPLMAAKKDEEELKQLQEWLLSYKPSELFTKDGGVPEDILKIIPGDDSKKLGQQIDTNGSHEELKLPDWKTFAAKKGGQASCMKVCGEMLDQTFVDNPHSIRVFSPDELVSNKLDAVFKHTGRNFQWDEFSNAQGGRVIEILSEHTCQGFMQGYTLTGRTALFPSYESFLGIIHTMMVQYSKFNKMVCCPRSPFPFIDSFQLHDLHRAVHTPATSSASSVVLFAPRSSGFVASICCADDSRTDIDRLARPHGAKTLAVSTTSKPVPGLDKNITAFPIKIPPSSAPF